MTRFGSILVSVFLFTALTSSNTASAQSFGADGLLAFNGGEGGGVTGSANPPTEGDTAVIILEGTYQGKNIYVNNPANVYGTDYAVVSVSLNGRPVADINKSNFMINLSGYEPGSYVKIEIKYLTKGFAPPQVLNASVIRSESTFELISFDVTEEFINWNTRNESSEEAFIIERDISTDMWPTWVLVGTIKGKGSKVYNEYRFPVEHYPGINKYRIKQRDGIYNYAYLPPIVHNSRKAPIALSEDNITAKLKLSEKTDFEIYDQYGRLILKGNGKTIDISNIASGTYFIKIENKTDTFVVK